MWARKHTRHVGTCAHKHARHVGTWARKHARHVGTFIQTHADSFNVWSYDSQHSSSLCVCGKINRWLCWALSSTTSENSLIRWRIMWPIQKLQKLCKSEFSCARFWYYSRMELLCNFHGKNLCDGVGRTVKHLATRASLQRPLDNQILTPYQLFEFASQDISGITSFYVDSETIKKTAAILEPWFAKAEHIKGTRNHHQFVHEGSSMRMIHISGSTSNVTNHIVDTNRMDLNNSHLVHIMLANMTMIFISVLSIMFPWNTVMLMWNSCTPKHLLKCFFGLIMKIYAGFPWIIWFAGSNLPPLVAQLDTIHLMKLALIKF